MALDVGTKASPTSDPKRTPCRTPIATLIAQKMPAATGAHHRANAAKRKNITTFPKKEMIPGRNASIASNTTLVPANIKALASAIACARRIWSCVGNFGVSGAVVFGVGGAIVFVGGAGTGAVHPGVPSVQGVQPPLSGSHGLCPVGSVAVSGFPSTY